MPFRHTPPHCYRPDMTDTTDDTGMTDDEKRRDQLLRLSGSTEADAAPRITIEEKEDGVTRIDVADNAAVRPGDPENKE
ncbi:hypothetical protein GCM10027029_01900 [Conyzicola lurida]